MTNISPKISLFAALRWKASSILAPHGSLFEMDITTNRVDAMNHYGIAREIAAIYNLQLKPLQIDLQPAATSQSPYSVVIETPDLCGRFTARVLRNVKIAPSHGIRRRTLSPARTKAHI